MKRKWKSRDILRERLPLVILITIAITAIAGAGFMRWLNDSAARQSNGLATMHYTASPGIILFAVPAFPVALLLSKLILNIPYRIERGIERDGSSQRLYKGLQDVGTGGRQAVTGLRQALRWCRTIPARLRAHFDGYDPRRDDRICVIVLVLGILSILCVLGLDFLLPLGALGVWLDALNILLAFVSLDAYVLLFGIPAILLAEFAIEHGAARSSLAKTGERIAFVCLVISFSPIGTYLPMISCAIIEGMLGIT